MEKEYLKIEDIPVVKEFPDVFPDELHGLPLDREIELTIDLAPGMEPFSKAPYRMTPIKMKELAMKLQELKFSFLDTINSEGIKVDPAKIEVIMNWERPKTPTEDYDCTISYHPGKANVIADALSRKERLNMLTSSTELIEEFEKLEIEMQISRLADEMLYTMKRPRVLVYGKSVVDVQSPEGDNSFDDFEEPRLKTSKRSRVAEEASVPEPGSYNSLIGINYVNDCSDKGGFKESTVLNPLYQSEGDSSNRNGEEVGGLGSDAEGGVLFEEMHDPEKVDSSNVCLDGDSLGVKEDSGSGLGSDFKQKGNISLETRGQDVDTEMGGVSNNSVVGFVFVLTRYYRVALPSDSDMLYSINKDKSMRVWNCDIGQCGEVVNFGDECGCLMCEAHGIENVVIIGSTPIGYTAAIYVARANLKSPVFERYQTGGVPGTIDDHYRSRELSRFSRVNNWPRLDVWVIESFDHANTRI
ncbi:hypothetical protein AgCh_020182 [Apium graveolens]